MENQPKIFPLGDGCVTVDFGREISTELNTKAISLAIQFTKNPFPGFLEAVPAYSSLSIFYDVLEVRRMFSEFDSAFGAVRWLAEAALEYPDEFAKTESRSVEIPVDFGEHAALDINFLAEHSGLSPDEVIHLFTSRSYRVFMLGFLPGFAYMGEVDDRIAAPRRDSPRTKVPKGSVGIASHQTGIYPFESPGGWRIVGRTDVELFSPDRDSPSLLAPGDEVRFIRIN
jgi:inhibitor of KinA